MTTENLTGKPPMLLSPERLAAYENLRAAADDLSHEAAWQGHESKATEAVEEALAALDRLDQGKP